MNKIKKITIDGQQGDVLLRKLSSFPAGTKKLIAQNRMVLAEGESTGHAHVVEEEPSQLFDVGGVMVLDLKEDSTLVHEEHGPMTLEKGLWEVGRVQEYDYFAQMKKRVVD